MIEDPTHNTASKAFLN